MNVRSIVNSNNLSDQAGSQAQAANLRVPSRYATNPTGANAAKQGGSGIVADGFDYQTSLASLNDGGSLTPPATTRYPFSTQEAYYDGGGI